MRLAYSLTSVVIQSGILWPTETMMSFILTKILHHEGHRDHEDLSLNGLLLPAHRQVKLAFPWYPLFFFMSFVLFMIELSF